MLFIIVRQSFEVPVFSHKTCMLVGCTNQKSTDSLVIHTIDKNHPSFSLFLTILLEKILLRIYSSSIFFLFAVTMPFVLFRFISCIREHSGPLVKYQLRHRNEKSSAKSERSLCNVKLKDRTWAERFSGFCRL